MGEVLNMALADATTSTPALSAADITTATENIFTVVGNTMNEIVTNPIFLMFFVSGLIFMAVRIIRRFKRV